MPGRAAARPHSFSMSRRTSIFRKGRTLFGLGLFLLAPWAPAQARFEDDAWAARPLSLGNAYTAVPEDASSLSWNPAGAGEAPAAEASLSLGKAALRGDDPRSREGSFFYRDGGVSPGAYGFWWTHAWRPEARRDNTYAFSYGRRVREGGRLSAGVNLKYRERAALSVPRAERAALSADLGLLHAPAPWFSWGLAARDVNRPDLGTGREDKAPLRLSLGTSFRPGAATLFTFDWSGDVTDEASHFTAGAGAEWRPWPWLALRGGAHSDFASGGLGLALPGRGARLDYAFSCPFDLKEQDRRHLLSLNVRFGGAAAQKGGAAATGSDFHEAAAELPAAGGVPEDRSKVLFLGPGDSLYVEVRNHPELDTSVNVDPWGFIKLPFIGELDVKGTLPNDLARKLEGIYAGFFTEAPVVEVTVKEYKSRVVYVMGAVHRPGRYNMGGNPLTIRDLMMLADLPTDRAALWRAFVIRQENGKVVYHHVNLHKILYRGQMKNNIELHTGDIVYVPMGILDAITSFIGRIVEPVFGVTRGAIAAASTGGL